jgi:hypothetical protein
MSFTRENATMFRVVSGIYVTSDRKVYDVTIQDLKGNEIATVGFTPRQTEGAMFWVDVFAGVSSAANSVIIKKMAKEYAKSQSVSWL